ncbi:hypothetical protein apy_11650, partial [Aeropyrum pernix]
MSSEYPELFRKGSTERLIIIPNGATPIATATRHTLNIVDYLGGDTTLDEYVRGTYVTFLQNPDAAALLSIPLGGKYLALINDSPYNTSIKRIDKYYFIVNPENVEKLLNNSSYWKLIYEDSSLALYENTLVSSYGATPYVGNKFVLHFGTADSERVLANYLVPSDYVVVGIANGTHLSIYVNGLLYGVEDAVAPYFDPYGYAKFAIGAAHGYSSPPMVVYAVAVFNGSIIDQDQVLNHVVRCKDGTLLLFYDPTFYDGTYYIDLSNHSNSIARNGVQRVEATKKWLWLIKGLRKDRFIHLEWFPFGTTVLFRDPITKEVIREIYIANNSVAIELPPRQYDVEAVIPLQANFSQFELAINNGNSSSAGLILKLSNVTVEAGDVI